MHDEAAPGEAVVEGMLSVPDGAGGRDASLVFDPLATRMSRLAALSKTEMATLRLMARSTRRYPAQSELCPEGEVRAPRVIIEGWAAQMRIQPNGQRQIIRFLLPGDVIGLLSRPTMRAGCATYSLTSVLLGSSELLLRALEREPAGGFATAVHEIETAVYAELYDQIVRLGFYASYQRVVHLILELHARLQRVGQVESDSFSLPLSQEMIAQSLGVSNVHVNRVIQEIRRDGLFELSQGQVKLLQLRKMQLTVGRPGRAARQG